MAVDCVYGTRQLIWLLRFHRLDLDTNTKRENSTRVTYTISVYMRRRSLIYLVGHVYALLFIILSVPSAYISISNCTVLFLTSLHV